MKFLAIFATILALTWARSVDPILPKPEAPIARPGVQSQVIDFPSAAQPIIRFHVNVKGDHDKRLPARVARAILPEWLVNQRESRPVPRPGQPMPEIEPPRVRPRPELPGGQLPEIQPEWPRLENPLPEFELPQVKPQNPLPEIEIPKGHLPSFPEFPQVKPQNPLPEIEIPKGHLPLFPELPEGGRRPLPNPKPEVPGVVLPEIEAPEQKLPLPPQRGPRPEIEIPQPGLPLPEIEIPKGNLPLFPEWPELKNPELLPRPEFQPGNPLPELKLPELFPRPELPIPEFQRPELKPEEPESGRRPMPRPQNPLPEFEIPKGHFPLFPELPGVVLPEVEAPEGGRRPMPRPEIEAPEQFVFYYPNREQSLVKLRIQVNDFEIFGRSQLPAYLPAAFSLLDPINPIVPIPPRPIQPKLEADQPAIEVFIDIGETESYY